MMTLSNQLFRSCLYMPADNEKVLSKASTLKADCVIFDLEDAVAPERKDIARNMLIEHLETFDSASKPALGRINAMQTNWFSKDINALANTACFGIVIPKITSSDEIFHINETLNNLGISQTFEIWAMIETAASIAEANSIAAAAQKTRLTTFIFGTNDLAKETHAPLLQGRENMMPWLAQATIAAKAYGVRVIDSVMQDFGDLGRLEDECNQAIGLGMEGKSLIHPKQLEIANKMFAPKPIDVEWSQKIVDAFNLPENSNKAVMKIDNKMVERLHYEMAEALLLKHKIILDKGF